MNIFKELNHQQQEKLKVACLSFLTGMLFLTWARLITEAWTWGIDSPIEVIAFLIIVISLAFLSVFCIQFNIKFILEDQSKIGIKSLKDV